MGADSTTTIQRRDPFRQYMYVSIEAVCVRHRVYGTRTNGARRRRDGANETRETHGILYTQ